MDKYTIDQIAATSVADALRDRLGTDNLYPSADWAQGILDIPSGGGGLPIWWEGEINVPSEMTANGTIETVTVEPMANANAQQFLLVVAEPEDKNFVANEVQWTVGFLGHSNSSAYYNAGFQYYKKGFSGAMGTYGVYVSASNRANRTMTFSASASTSRVIKAGKWHITIYDLITMPAVY